VALASVSAEPRPGGAEVECAEQGLAEGAAVLHPGDCYAALLRPRRAAPAAAEPLGDLVVTWRRAGCGCVRATSADVRMHASSGAAVSMKSSSWVRK